MRFRALQFSRRICTPLILLERALACAWVRDEDSHPKSGASANSATFAFGYKPRKELIIQLCAPLLDSLPNLQLCPHYAKLGRVLTYITCFPAPLSFAVIDRSACRLLRINSLSNSPHSFYGATVAVSRRMPREAFYYRYPRIAAKERGGPKTAVLSNCYNRALWEVRR